MKNDQLTNEVLDFLSVKRDTAGLIFLNKIIKNHQEKIKWETLTKIIDWEHGEQSGQFLPSIEMYFRRILNKGVGGTCWTHACGLHWLLTQLEFNVHYVYMDPGHLCLRVDLDQPYYVDVGYCAPLFQAYPLFESFSTKNERETFDYSVTSTCIEVVRTPGPTKILNPNPIAFDDMQPIIKRSNDWKTSPFLQDILIFGYLDGISTSLKNHVLKQHFNTHNVEQELSKEEREYWVTERFGVDKSIYKEALEIYEKKINMYN